MYCCFVNHDAVPETKFTATLPMSDGKAKTITNAVLEKTRELGLDPQKMVALGSDGASVMLGSDGASVMLGSDGASVMLGSDGASVMLGSDGASVMLGRQSGVEARLKATLPWLMCCPPTGPSC